MEFRKLNVRSYRPFPLLNTSLCICSRPVNEHTVRRRLTAQGIRNRRPYHGAILTRRHRANRLIWAQQHQRWTRRQWAGVLFADESRFNLSIADGRYRVWRRRGERYANCCVLEYDRWGGGGVMVWAGISAHRRTRLHFIDGALNARRYIDNVLRPTVVPFIAQHGGIFQHDNATPHRARITQAFLQENNTGVLEWPALSPDMAPIEHIWDELGRRVYRRHNPPQTLQELRNALDEEWTAIPQHFIERTINSMRRRCNDCLRARGGHTRY